ncbi:MAG: DUF4190 domain-containing protein [Catenulispora sp.]
MATPSSRGPSQYLPDGTPGRPGQAPLPGQLGYPGQAGVGPAPEPVPAAYGYGYPPAPSQPANTSRVAVVALCLFWVPVVGLVLAVIGMVKTAGGRARGRGLAIAALVLSILVTAGTGVAIGSKTSALDPGCTHGKRAVLEQDKQIEADTKKSDKDAVRADFQTLLNQLAKAATEAGRDDVRAAVQAVHDDYAAILSGTDDSAKLTTDLQQMDHLCTIGK